MTIDLSGARVLVIGGSSGIGQAAAGAFAEVGADVFVASRGGAGLDSAAALIGATPVVLDTHDEQGLESFFAASDPFDHVVISAARTRSGPVRQLPLADAQASMESKFWGAYRVARLVPIAPGGSLTFVSGFLSSRPSATSVLQGAINAALEALARGLALELAPVRVNAVSPGLIDTPAYAAMSEADRSSMFTRVAGRLPVGRVGAPGDVAAAVLLVATNPFMTGATLTVDGGGTIA